jgi:hypothetical protein
LGHFAKQKVANVVYPYLLWATLQVSLQGGLREQINHPESYQGLTRILYSPPGQFWFLYTLLLIQILYYAISQMRSPAATFFVVAVFLYFLPLLQGLGSLWAPYQICWNTIYFAVGVLAAEWRLPRMLGRVPMHWMLLIAMVGSCAVVINALTAFQDQYLLRPATALLGCVAVVSVSSILARYRSLSFLITWGALSLEIYVAHTVFSSGIRILLQKGLHVDNTVVHCLLGVVIGLYGPVLLATGAQRVGVKNLFRWRRSSARLSEGQRLGERT